MNGQYSNREIDMKFKIIEQTMHDSHLSIQEKLDLILQQTTQHNGRMRKIEAWRNILVGAIGVISVLVVPVVLEFVKGHLNF